MVPVLKPCLALITELWINSYLQWLDKCLLLTSVIKLERINSGFKVSDYSSVAFDRIAQSSSAINIQEAIHIRRQGTTLNSGEGYEPPGIFNNLMSQLLLLMKTVRYSRTETLRLEFSFFKCFTMIVALCLIVRSPVPSSPTWVSLPVMLYGNFPILLHSYFHRSKLMLYQRE